MLSRLKQPQDLFHVSRAPALPEQLHVSLTERCCLPCKMCDIWKAKPGRELTLDEWKGLFDQMAAWAGPVALNFSGGEPLIRKDFAELVAHGSAHGFTVTSNTNGVLLTEDLATRIEDAGLEELFIALDGIRPETHDRLRGKAGTFGKAMRALDIMEDHRRVRTVIAAVMHRDNIGEIPGLLAEAERRGFFLIFQPLFHNFGRPFDARWVEDSKYLPRPEDYPLLDEMIDMLSDVRDKGGPVCNPVAQLQGIKQYFHSPAVFNGLPCNAGHSDIAMDPYGNVLLCFWLPPVGNAMKTPVPWLWNHPRAMHRRWQIEHCTQTCNVLNCNFERAV